MNNEFEKSFEPNNINDNTSELINNGEPEALYDHSEDNAEERIAEDIGYKGTDSLKELFDKVREEEAAGMIPDQGDDGDNIDIEISPSEALEAGESLNGADVQRTHREENSCIPGSQTYLYSKTGNGEENTVGCVWENTSSPKEKRRTVTLTGFKVFTVAMLCIFALSTLTIAGFLALDFMQDKNAYAAESESADNAASDNRAVANPPIYNGQTTLVSKFADVTNGLTKSQVATKCSPSAVGIVIEQEQTYSGYSFPFGFGYDFNIPGGTQIVQGSGSGFIFSADGYIITNHHVINGASKITVYLHDGTTAEAELIGSDALSDIAVIKIDSTDRNLIPMEIGDSSVMKVGDEVIAIGCPAGIEFMGTVTDGIISAINRDVELDNDGSSTTKTMTLLQTNATINRGNSGGPLINTSGQVIGINTLKLSADYEGIGFSIPINGALPIINQLIEHGKVVERTESFVSSEGVIGISASEITEQESKYYDIPMGVLVVQIDKDSSASKAGLRRGDIITKFNDEEVTTVNQLNKLKSSFKAGDEVTLTVYRDSDDESDTFNITFKLDMAE